MISEKMRLSHVLYHVNDLHAAVKKLQDAGFVVEYGTSIQTAYNAIIWFEDGVFVEIYHNAGLPTLIKWLMKIFGYQSVLDRMDKWQQTGEGWCEWSLESTVAHLDWQKALFKNKSIAFKSHKAKRKDIYGKILKWQLVVPDTIDFPFLMSAYVPNPRPPKITHPNGINRVSKIVVGTENLDDWLLRQLLPEQTGLELVANKRGLQTIEFSNSDLKIENILK